MQLVAALLFAIGLVVRLIDGTSPHDPWVWAFAGLLCLALPWLLPWHRPGQPGG